MRKKKKNKLSLLEKYFLKRIASKLGCDIDGDMYNVMVNTKTNTVVTSRLPGKILA